MAQQTINVGAAPNDGTGDPLRTAFTKSNDNFTELYPQDVPHCGRFEYVSATACKFAPYNGDRIKINGVIYAIPSAGIAGLTNSGLSASTLYYAYAYNNSGTITGEFSTTTHATSTTAGNVGTEIKSGDNTRTLIGMVFTNASSQFENANANRRVISWFNRRNIMLYGASTGGATTASGAPVELTTAARVNLITWGEESVHLGLYGGAYSTTAATISYQIGADGSTNLTTSVQGTSFAASYWVSCGAASVVNFAEGSHYVTPMGTPTAGTGSFYIVVTAMIRG